MKVNSLQLEAMVRTLLDEYQQQSPYASVTELVNIVVLILRSPEAIFSTRILPNRQRHTQYLAWYDALSAARNVQYELSFK